MPINLDLFIFVNFNESNKLCFNININIKICILNVLKKILHINSYGGHETNDNLKSIKKMYRPMIAIYRDVTI